MVRRPDQSGDADGDGARVALLARLLELQPQLRRRFDAVVPATVRDLRASLREGIAGVTVGQLEVVRDLATRGPLAMHELAELRGITRSSATEAVDRLVEHGLAERRHDVVDRRIVEVALTARAEALVAQVRQAHQASVRALMNVLDDGELETLLRLMEKLALPGGAAAPTPPGAMADPCA